MLCEFCGELIVNTEFLPYCDDVCNRFANPSPTVNPNDPWDHTLLDEAIRKLP